MGRLPDSRVVHVEVVPDGAHHHLARVETNADVDREPAVAVQLFGVRLHRLLHPERRVTRAHGMVLVSERRAEERHDAITHHLVHRALVAVHRFHHPLEHRVQEFAGVLGIAFGQELHRALEVGEQDGHLLSFTLEGGLRADDLLGEVFRGVRGRRGEPGLTSRGDRPATLGAELGGRRDLGPAAGAPDGERAPAFLAELRVGRTVVLTSGALHPRCASLRLTGGSKRATG